MTASSGDPGKASNSDSADGLARDLGELRAEFAAGFDGIATAFNDLQHTWDAGVAETLLRLGEMRERTDELCGSCPRTWPGTPEDLRSAK